MPERGRGKLWGIEHMGKNGQAMGGVFVLEAADEPLTDRRHDLASTPHLAQTHAVWQIGSGR